MTVDFGTQVVTTAGTAEPLTNDLDTNSKVLASTIVNRIAFKAPATNSGLVFIGRLKRDNSGTLVSSTYGFTLAANDPVLELEDISEKFSNFEVDAATNGDKIEWWCSFQPGAGGRK